MHTLTRFFALIRSSFYDRAAYQVVAKEGFSGALFYALISAALMSLVICVAIVPLMYALVRADVGPSVVDRLYPEGLVLTITNGVASSSYPGVVRLSYREVFGDEMKLDEKQPYNLLTIDTESDFSVDQLELLDSSVVLGRTTLYIQNKPQEVRVYPLKEVKEFTVTEEKVNSFIAEARPWVYVGAVILPVFFFLLMVVFSTVYYLILGALLAFVTILVYRLRKSPLSYSAAYTVTLYAMIPTACFDLLTDVVRFGNSFWLTMLVFLLVVVYTSAPLGVHAPETT